jgi:DNA-binding NarL/FixJ family response regulator
MEVVGEACNGEEAVQCCQELMPEVVTVDVHMPVVNGIEATRRIRSQFPSIRAVAVSSDPEEISIERMLAAGASGYVLKEFLYEELVLAIRAIARNRAFVGRCAIDGLLDDLEPRLEEDEAAVLRGLAQGRNKRQIALSLELAPDVLEQTLRSAHAKTAASAIGNLIKRVGIE